MMSRKVNRDISTVGLTLIGYGSKPDDGTLRSIVFRFVTLMNECVKIDDDHSKQSHDNNIFLARTVLYCLADL